MELPKVTQGQPHLAKQDLGVLDINKLTPLSPEVISRQATINIGKPSRLTSVSLKSKPPRFLFIFLCRNKIDRGSKLERLPTYNFGNSS